jgi:hypothetical protein
METSLFQTNRQMFTDLLYLMTLTIDMDDWAVHTQREH